MVIRSLCRELGRPIEAVWVKGHQDNTVPYHQLNQDARHNVDADNLATWYRNNLPRAPQQKRDHIPEEKISITIQGHRYLTKMDEHIRYHVNGYYLRQYMQSKHGWANSTWDRIDFHSLYRFRCKLGQTEQNWMLKLIHDQLPLGSHRIRTSTVDDPNLALCPCCKAAVEDRHHFLTCKENKSFSTGLTTFQESICGRSGINVHVFNYILVELIMQWLRHGPRLPSIDSPILSYFDYHTLSPELLDGIRRVLHDQTMIGWDHALTGILAKSWIGIANSGNPSESGSDWRLYLGLKGILSRAHSMWQARNHALHGSSETEESRIYTTESATIRYYHSRPHLLSVTDQHYCTQSLLRILRGSPSTRRRWLMRVRKARAAFLKDGQHQRRITAYYRSVQSAPPQQVPDAQNHQWHGATDTRRKDHDRILLLSRQRQPTAQSVITKFFPSARPPDHSRTLNDGVDSPQTENPRSN